MNRLPRCIETYGPDALLINWEPLIDPAISCSVHAYARTLQEHPAVVECVVAYASLLVRYLRPKTTAYQLREYIYDLQPTAVGADAAVHHDFPVCYHASLAPDLKETVALLKTTRKTLIKQHCAVDYLVYQIGFRPGFGFLGQTDERLAVPRHATPRTEVPAGAVGLAGCQTGIYPTAGPGGWRLIGRCPVPLLRKGRDFARLRAGDTVRFHPVSLADFRAYSSDSTPWQVR